MATLEQMNKILGNSIDSLNAYTRIFNTASKEVTSDIDVMGKSVVDLQNQLNSLFSQAKQLKDLGANIKLDDKGQVDGFISKVSDLDKSISSITPSIAAGLREMNEAFEREFKLPDGTAGYLKQQLNELVSLFTDSGLQNEVEKFAPDLSKWATDFVKQVDIIEYNMGRLTEYGKTRNETEKALGFDIQRKDIEPILEAKRTELSDLDMYAKNMGYKGLNDKEFLADNEDIEKQINGIKLYMSQLEASVGKKLTGYIDLFNEANNALQAGKANESLFSTIASPMSRSIYEEGNKGIDWNKVTPSSLREMENNLDVGDDFDDFLSPALETKTFDDIKESIDKAVSSVRDYDGELKKLIETDKVLSEEQKQGILGQDYSKSIEKYRQNVDWLQNDLKNLGNIKLNDAVGTTLNPNKNEDAVQLTNYISRINESIDALEQLKSAQANVFSSLADPSKIKGMYGLGIDTEAIKQIQGTLESGYKVNLIDGSADKEKLDTLRKEFEQLISNFGKYKISLLDDNQISSMVKLGELESEISKEISRQEKEAQATANYERDKLAYLAKQKEIMQAQANIEALKTARDYKLGLAGSKSERDSISTQYNTAISDEIKIRNNAQAVLDKLRKGFEKYNLEVPVTPVVSTRANLKGTFKDDYMSMRRSGRDEIIGGLRGQDEEIQKLNNQARELGINVDRVTSRLNAVGNTIRNAFNSGDIEKARGLMSAYSNEVDNLRNKVNGQARAQEISADRQKAAIKNLLEETKNYVSTQEALSGKPMSYDKQAEYYTNQLPKFVQGTREYIEVLKLKNQAEQRAAEEAQKASDKEKQAHLDALNAAKQRVNSVLSAVKSLADGINSAINKIVGIIRTGISLINKIISGTTKFISSIGRGIKGIIALFGNLGNRVRQTFLGVSDSGEKVNNSFNILKGSATELRSKILLLKGAFDTLFNSEMVKKAENLMASVYSLRNIAGSNVTQEVLDWANAMEFAFGISAKELIGDINELTGVLYGLGMSAEDTAVGSENILMMSRYLAFMGAAGGDVNLVMNKLVSGMKGMTQAIDDLGLSVRDAQMNAFLKSLKAQGGEFANIATDFSSLNEQARVYVRYASLIDQFTRNYDITNFADALTTVTGRMQILRQSVSSLITTLGTGLTKVLANLATYLIPVIKMLETLVTKIFAFFGIDVTMSTDINEGTAALGGLNDGLDDTKDKLDEVSESAKKAGGNLQSFDRINNVTSSSGSGSSGEDGFDYSKLMASMLDNLNKLAAEASVSYSDKLMENLKNKLNEMREAFVQFAKDITGRENFDLEFNWPKIKNNLQAILSNIATLIKSWGSFIIEIGLKIADDVNLGLLITKLTDLLAKISEVAVAITNVLIPAFRAFYDIALSPIVQYIGEILAGAIDFIIEELDKWGNWFTENSDTILRFFVDLAEIVNAAWEVIKPFLDAGWSLLGEQIANVGDRLREAFGDGMADLNANKPSIIEWIKTELPGIIDNAVVKIGEFWDALRGKESLDTVVSNQGTAWGEFLQILMSVNSIVRSLMPILAELLGLFGEFAKNELLPWINEKLSELSVWLSQNRDSIVDFLTKIGSLAWDGFKVFVDLVGKLIDFVVNNPDTVINFFKGLLALKVGSWFLDVAANIGFMVVGLQNLGAALPAIGSAISGGLATIGSAIGASGVGSWGASLAATFGAGGLGEVIAAFAGPIALVVAAIVGLIAAFKDLWDTTESFRAAFANMGESISEHWQKLKDAFTGDSAFGGLVDQIKELGSTLYEIYEATLKPILEALFKLLGEVGTGVINGFLDALTGIVNYISSNLSGAVQILNGLLDVLIGLFTLDPDRMLEGLQSIFSGILEVLQSIPQLITDAAIAIGDVIVGVFAGIGEMFVAGLGEGIRSAWDGFLAWLNELWQGLVDSVKNFFGINSPSTVFAEIGSFLISGLWQGIQNAWGAFVEGVTNLFNGLLSTIKNIFSGLGDFFSTTFQNAKDMAVNAWSNAGEKFNEVKNKITGTFDGLKENIKSTFETAKQNAINVWGDVKGTFSGVADNIASGLGTLKGKVSAIFNDVKATAKNALADIGQKANTLWGSIKSGVSTAWNTVTRNTSATTGRRITSHAVGGSIAGGQLFIANEGGVPELIGNIDGTGRTNVANNTMIMQAMESGIFEAVYNAMAEVLNQRRNTGMNTGNTTLRIDGFGLIDQSTLRELARMLAPYLNSNDVNIADTGFSI